MKMPRFATAGSNVLLLSALLLVALVIPSVKADHFPAATPERAVPALWFMVGCNLAFALILLGLSWIRTAPVTMIRRILTGVIALVILLTVLALIDGAGAYWGHGPDMRLASIAMFVCAAANALAAVLTVATILRRETGSMAA